MAGMGNGTIAAPSRLFEWPFRLCEIGLSSIPASVVGSTKAKAVFPAAVWSGARFKAPDCKSICFRDPPAQKSRNLTTVCGAGPGGPETGACLCSTPFFLASTYGPRFLQDPAWVVVLSRGSRVCRDCSMPVSAGWAWSPDRRSCFGGTEYPRHDGFRGPPQRKNRIPSFNGAVETFGLSAKKLQLRFPGRPRDHLAIPPGREPQKAQRGGIQFLP